jgi:hypothetical protein
VYNVAQYPVHFIAYKIPNDVGRYSHGDYIFSGCVPFISTQTITAQEKKDILRFRVFTRPIDDGRFYFICNMYYNRKGKMNGGLL